MDCSSRGVYNQREKQDLWDWIHFTDMWLASLNNFHVWSAREGTPFFPRRSEWFKSEDPGYHRSPGLLQAGLMFVYLEFFPTLLYLPCKLLNNISKAKLFCLQTHLWHSVWLCRLPFLLFTHCCRCCWPWLQNHLKNLNSMALVNLDIVFSPLSLPFPTTFGALWIMKYSAQKVTAFLENPLLTRHRKRCFPSVALL